VFNNSQIAEDSYCESERPVDAEECNDHSCPYWLVGKWSECSKPCRSSRRHRNVTCYSKGQRVDEFQCNQTSKPAEFELCTRIDCPTWHTGNWSLCSTDCGQGYQTRVVYCQMARTKTRVEDEEECDLSVKPSRTIECKAKCPEWQVTPWSDCSARCGKGVKTRQVYCSNGKTDSCPLSSKPTYIENCYMQPCINTWKVGNWSEVIMNQVEFSLFLFFKLIHQLGTRCSSCVKSCFEFG
jgi:hypothetical protein